MLGAIQQLLFVLLEEAEPSLEQLSHALARLDLSYFETAEGDVAETENEPPRSDYAELYRQITNRFPTLGTYWVVWPDGKPDADVVLVDAVDDLADIAGDLKDVLRILELHGEADARWTFRFTYQSHWGLHLSQVRRYLYAQAQWICGDRH